MPELVFFRRGEEVLRVSLEREHLVLGRAETCAVVIPDQEVHAPRRGGGATALRAVPMGS